MRMPAWFDINFIPLSQSAFDDEPGILKSVEQINQLISTEVESGIPSSRIVLGGFSQGGAMSLVTGLTGERKLAGLLVLSGWLPLRNKIKTMTSHAPSIPIFMGHGSADPVVDPHVAQVSAEFLTSSLGIPRSTSISECKGLIYNVYPRMGHSTVPKELDDVTQWIKQALPA
ncbi:alpha/beta-hydrolase [Tricholoma matsutake]|nr:alpha/beta-hydrolase [Tricholoma matsutake 945]